MKTLLLILRLAYSFEGMSTNFCKVEYGIILKIPEKFFQQQFRLFELKLFLDNIKKEDTMKQLLKNNNTGFNSL